jgi:18S rRNA (guanine1575-N7)-methyltransferase
MATRALELLNLPADQSAMLLDIGCGSGLSGQVLEEHGHQWIGLDISPAMLDKAVEREVDGDVMLHDVGQAIGFRPGSFDGAIRLAESDLFGLLINV